MYNVSRMPVGEGEAMAPKLELDHIAVCAPTVEDGVRHVRERLGVEVPQGGDHAQMGTHNHLMRLGLDEFLEIIAIDPAAPRPMRARWFALDRSQDQAAKLSTWVVRTPDIEASLAAAVTDIGRPTRITRGDLSWLISIADDGSMPFDGAHPTFIMWPERPFPGAGMPDLGCRLVRLTVEHPKADEISKCLAPVFSDPRVIVASGTSFRMSAEIQTPTGIKLLI